MWKVEKTNGLKKQTSVLLPHAQGRLYALLKDNSLLKDRYRWRDLFKDLLKNHSERGLYLKGLRLREGYTQVQLAGMIGVSPNAISAMEGKRPISKDSAVKLAHVFNIHYQRFL
jgi:DNA-binding XRE family transcriptional regulator